MRGDAGERAALEPRRRRRAGAARSRTPRSSVPRCGANAACVSGGRSRRSVSEPPRVEVLGRIRERVEERLDRGGRSALVARPLVQQPHAMHRIAHRRLQPSARTSPGRRQDRCPSAASTTAIVEAELRPRAPCRAASRPGPRRRSRSRGRAASSGGSARAAARSVSAVPIDATTGSKPAWRSAITSVLPSTTTARSCFAIGCRARVEPVEEVALLEERRSPASSRTSPAAGRRRRACAPGSRAPRRARRRAGRRAGA